MGIIATRVDKATLGYWNLSWLSIGNYFDNTDYKLDKTWPVKTDSSDPFEALLVGNVYDG